MSADFTLGKVLVTLKTLFDILALLIQKPSRDSIHFARLILKIKPRFTMVRNRNLINLYKLVQAVNHQDLPGDIVECGVWNGGSAAMMGVAGKQGRNAKLRTMWLFDSFQGLPHPSAEDGQREKKDYFPGWNKGNMDKVKTIFNKFGLELGQVKIIPGWFESTLSKTPIDSIALLHIDADWYDSVKTVLDAFYEKVVPGGFIILDDYGYWKGCTEAVKDFLSEKAIDGITIRRVNKGGAFFQKPLFKNYPIHGYDG